MESVCKDVNLEELKGGLLEKSWCLLRRDLWGENTWETHKR